MLTEKKNYFQAQLIAFFMEIEGKINLNHFKR